MSINLQEIINKLQTAKIELQQQGRFSQYAEGLDAIITHTSEPLMLMVMGSFSTGKSSFINALVGEEIAAVEAKPTTAVVTKLCYGAQDKLLLHFRDGSVKTATPKEFNRMTAVNDEAQLNAIHEKLDYVERQMPIDILKQISIIDSPGLNDVAEKHSEATERFVNKADTLLWMFSTVQLGTREEMAAMDKLTPRLKPIAIVNKMDLIDEEEDDPQEILANAKKMLQDRVQAVVGISAKYELEGKKENNALKRELGNFAELEKAVADLVLPHREKFKLNTLLDELGSYFDAINSDFTEAKQENEENKSSNYALYMQNEEKFMQVEDILNSVVRGIFDYCEREAGQNNEQALFLLGVLYQSGIGVLQDTEKALKFYQKAAMKNHQNAMLNLYVYYRDHSADETANYWLKKLAEQGVAEAQDAYANTLHKDKKYEEAVQWYEKAAKQGLAVAQTHLVECYVHGIGVSVDYAVAKQWCEKAVAQEYCVAQYFMAEYFIRREQYELYKKAAEQGYDEAQNAVGRFLKEGWGGITKNEAVAVEWFRKAAEQGFSEAQYNLAVCLENGEGCREDKAEAVEWYRKAAEQGYEIAIKSIKRITDDSPFKDNNVQILQYRNNNRDSIDELRKAAESGDIEAQYELGTRLYYGNKCNVNNEEAVKWFRKAAEQGYTKAQYLLGQSLVLGMGCKKDKEEAERWLRKAAKQGHTKAKDYLKLLIEVDESSSQNFNPNDLMKLRKKAELGDVVEQNNLGNCLYYGRGCEKNLVEAVLWYRRAAEQGYDKAQNNLAQCLENGEGCEQDIQEALEWYKRAAEQGNSSAESGIERIQCPFDIRPQQSTSSQVAAQSSGCLLPILVTLAVIGALIAF